MSYLAANIFDDSFTTIDITQRVQKGVSIQVVRIKMIKVGTIADGTLTLDIYDGATLLGSKALTYNDFNRITNNGYGYVAFALDNAIRVNNLPQTTYTELTFRLTMSGHTEDSNNYIGLIREFDDPIIGEHGTRPPSQSNPAIDNWYRPFGIEICNVLEC